MISEQQTFKIYVFLNTTWGKQSLSNLLYLYEWLLDVQISSQAVDSDRLGFKKLYDLTHAIYYHLWNRDDDIALIWGNECKVPSTCRHLIHGTSLPLLQKNIYFTPNSPVHCVFQHDSSQMPWLLMGGIHRTVCLPSKPTFPTPFFSRPCFLFYWWWIGCMS